MHLSVFPECVLHDSLSAYYMDRRFTTAGGSGRFWFQDPAVGTIATEPPPCLYFPHEVSVTHSTPGTSFWRYCPPQRGNLPAKCVHCMLHLPLEHKIHLLVRWWETYDVQHEGSGSDAVFEDADACIRPTIWPTTWMPHTCGSFVGSSLLDYTQTRPQHKTSLSCQHQPAQHGQQHWSRLPWWFFKGSNDVSTSDSYNILSGCNLSEMGGIVQQSLIWIWRVHCFRLKFCLNWIAYRGFSWGLCFGWVESNCWKSVGKSQVGARPEVCRPVHAVPSSGISKIN